MMSPRAAALLASPVGFELFYLIEWRNETSLTDKELMSRALEARSSASVYRGDYFEHVRFVRSQGPRYVDLAERISARMERWWDPLDRNAQIWASHGFGPPAAADLATDLSQMHVEAPKPRRALWTSTFIPGILSQWLEHHERQSKAVRRLWRLRAPEDARVFEVHSPRDWSDLARAYPSKLPGFRYAVVPLPSHPGVVSQDRSEGSVRLDPNWEALANDYDAVHVSMAGVMTAEDVPFERDGVVTELRGWDIESTVWLRWVFDSVEEIDVHG